MRKLLPVVMIATFILSCRKNNDNPNALNSTDKNFLIQTYLASKAEIQFGRLALAKAGNPAIKNFGQRMISDYQELQSDLIAVANKINFGLADTISVSAQNASFLNELNGYSFDTAYIRGSADRQRSILDFFQEEISKGNNTYVKYYFVDKYYDEVRMNFIEADSISRRL